MRLNDAIARLNRAGDENSRTTQKLFDAAKEVATLIENSVPINARLPRGYVVRELRSNVGYASFLESPHCNNDGDTFFIDGFEGYLHNDFHVRVRKPSRNIIMQFASDIADGWLDEVAAWLEDRSVKSAEATATLIAAAQKVF